MQHVLYAADFSERDRNSFEQACRFARAWRAKLLIAHVDDSGDRSREQEPRMANSLELLDIFPSDLEIDYDHILRNGDPVQVILDIEKEFDTDLIVLGTHGRKGLERVFAGSVAEQVLRQAQCPVLTVRHSQQRI